MVILRELLRVPLTWGALMSVFSSEPILLLLSRLKLVKEQARSASHALDLWRVLRALRQSATGDVEPELALGIRGIVAWMEQKRLQRDVLGFLESSGPTRRQEILIFLHCLPSYENMRESALDTALQRLEAAGQLRSMMEPHDDQPTYDIAWRGQDRPTPTTDDDAEAELSPLMAELLRAQPPGTGAAGFFTSVVSTAKGIKTRVTRRKGRLEPADGEDGFIGAGELRGKIRSDLYWPLVISLRQFIEAEMQHHRLASEREFSDQVGELFFRGMVALQPHQPDEQDPDAGPNDPQPDPEALH